MVLRNPLFKVAYRRYDTNLEKRGCSNIQFGLESYNQRVLDLMDKNIDIAWIEPNIINCFEAGISVHLFFMTGFPTETLEEAKNTYHFANEMILKSKRIMAFLILQRDLAHLDLKWAQAFMRNPKYLILKF